MNASRTTTVQANRLSPADETKPGFRTKTISTRLPPEELAEVETAAERAGISPYRNGSARRPCGPRASGRPTPLNWCWPRCGLCAIRC